MTGDLTDKEKVIHRLEGKELKYYLVQATNVVRVRIEATSEKEAERIFNEKVVDDCDFPYEEAEDEDGWEIENVEETY